MQGKYRVDEFYDMDECVEFINDNDIPSGDIVGIVTNLDCNPMLVWFQKPAPDEISSMTEKELDELNGAIDILENEMACVKKAAECARNCAECSLVRDDEEIINGYKTALELLRLHGTNLMFQKSFASALEAEYHEKQSD